MENKFVNETGAAKVSPFKIRFADAPWFLKAQDNYVLILGAGGIGSNLIFLLSSVGVNMNIWDNDVIGAENISAQSFQISQIGMSKVDAIKVNARAYMGQENTIDVSNTRYDKDSPANPITFLGFDNMSSRKLAYEKWVELLESDEEDNRKNYILIDGRLNCEIYQVFTVTKDNYKKYAETLFEDSEVADQPCTMKATRFASWGIVSDMTAIYLNWCTNKVYEDDDIREVPFKVEKSYPNLYYKVE